MCDQRQESLQVGQEGWRRGGCAEKGASIWWVAGSCWRKSSCFACCHIPSSREVPGTWSALDQSVLNELNESHRMCLLRVLFQAIFIGAPRASQVVQW